MNNPSETFAQSMRALGADEERLREIGLGLLVPVEELVPAILATLDDLPETWPLRTSRAAS